MEDYNFHRIFEDLVHMFNNCYDFLRRNEDLESECLAIDMAVACMNKEMMTNTVLKFQSYISIVIMEKIFEQEVMQRVIQVMDILYQANQLKEPADRINDSEFYNDALNNEVDLRKQAEIFYREWMAAKNAGKVFNRFDTFTLYNYPWTLNAHRKAELFRIISDHSRAQNINDALLQNLNSFFTNVSPNQMINQIIGDAHLTLKIDRNNLLDDSIM